MTILVYENWSQVHLMTCKMGFHHLSVDWLVITAVNSYSATETPSWQGKKIMDS